MSEVAAIAAPVTEETQPTTETVAIAAPPVAKRLRRVFEYNGARLDDPDPAMSLQDVKRYYTTRFPELINATITMKEGGVRETETARQETWILQEGVRTKSVAASGGEQVYEVKRSTGTKG